MNQTPKNSTWYSIAANLCQLVQTHVSSANYRAHQLNQATSMHSSRISGVVSHGTYKCRTPLNHNKKNFSLFSLFKVSAKLRQLTLKNKKANPSLGYYISERKVNIIYERVRVRIICIICFWDSRPHSCNYDDGHMTVPLGGSRPTFQNTVLLHNKGRSIQAEIQPLFIILVDWLMHGLFIYH